VASVQSTQRYPTDVHVSRGVQLGLLMIARVWLVVGIVVLVSACSGAVGPVTGGSQTPSSGVAATGPTGSTSGSKATESTDPLVDFVVEAFGHDLVAIGAAVERAVTDTLASCMVAEGWEYSPVAPLPMGPSGPERIPLAERLMQDLQAGSSSEGGERDPGQEAAYNEDLARCYQEAVEAVPNPAARVLEWLDGETADLYERVAADPRVVEAALQEERCLAEAGFPDPTAEETALMDRGQQVAAEARDGVLTVEEATKELEDLSAAQRTLWEIQDRCTGPRVEIERQVAAELERGWLADNGDRLALVLAELRPDLEMLADELAAVEAER